MDITKQKHIPHQQKKISFLFAFVLCNIYITQLLHLSDKKYYICICSTR